MDNMKMNRQTARISRSAWSVLLCLVMVLGMLPTAALAEEAEPPAGSFSVSVTDEAETPLPGAKFWLSPQGSGNSYFATSGSDGLATFTDVMSGTYKLTEQVEPEGYVGSDDAYVVSATSGSDGLATFTDVMSGTYELTEQIEPDGYVISDDTYIVVVDHEGGVNYLYPVDGSPEDSVPFGPGATIATFVNAPSPEVTLTIPVTKIVRCGDHCRIRQRPVPGGHPYHSRNENRPL